MIALRAFNRGGGGGGGLELIYSSLFLERPASRLDSTPTVLRPTSLISRWSIPSLCGPHREKTQLEHWPNDCVSRCSIGDHHLRGAAGEVMKERGGGGQEKARGVSGWGRTRVNRDEIVGVEGERGKSTTGNNKRWEGRRVRNLKVVLGRQNEKQLSRWPCDAAISLNPPSASWRSGAASQLSPLRLVKHQSIILQLAPMWVKLARNNRHRGWHWQPPPR